MDIYISLASILGALLIGAISPGPGFVLVARPSIAVSRADGLYMAIGMGIGGVISAVLVLAGLHAVIISVPWLYMTLKLFGSSDNTIFQVIYDRIFEFENDYRPSYKCGYGSVRPEACFRYNTTSRNMNHNKALYSESLALPALW